MDGLVKPKVLFLIWTSYEAGYGHFYRTLELAHQFNAKEFDVVFYFEANSQSSVIEKIQVETTYRTYVSDLSLSEQPTLQDEFIKAQDWCTIVIDHPQIKPHLEAQLATCCENLVVYEDDIRQVHTCEVLVNPNFGVVETQYPEAHTTKPILCVGSKYIALRTEFLIQSKRNWQMPQQAVRLNVYFGNSRVANDCIPYVEWLLMNFPDIHVDFVIPETSDNQRALQALIQNFSQRLTHYHSVDNMAKLLSEANLAFGAPGITTWERAYLGIPTCYITFNQLQYNFVHQLKQEGVCELLGMVNELDESYLVKQVAQFMSNKKDLKRMSEKSMRLIDGLGAQRIFSKIHQEAFS